MNHKIKSVNLQHNITFKTFCFQFDAAVAKIFRKKSEKDISIYKDFSGNHDLDFSLLKGALYTSFYQFILIIVNIFMTNYFVI